MWHHHTLPSRILTIMHDEMAIDKTGGHRTHPDKTGPDLKPSTPTHPIYLL